MIASVEHGAHHFKIDLSKPLDISIPIIGTSDNVNAWYLEHPTIDPHKEDGFTGSVKEGAPVNFNTIRFNPHAHVTHTECVGHITKEVYSINQHLDRYFFVAVLITVAPERYKDDFVISKSQLQYALGQQDLEALVIRTLPNTEDKLNRQYSNTNPPYLLEEAIDFLKTKNVQHLLVDLPSVDREKDEGALLAHKAFWNIGGDIRKNATITEFVYVPNTIHDGTYALNLQLAPIENDASPSRPVLYEII